VKLTGSKKRAFMAKATQDYFKGNPRQAETYMGWSRTAIAKGLKELETGIVCQENHQRKGRKKVTEKLPQLEDDIRYRVEVKSQAEPKFQRMFYYARISAEAVRKALIEEKNYQEEELPSRQTMGTILKRMGYRLKKHKK
jgi:hypothetical protein